MTDVERTARTALEEMRRMLGLLRPPGDVDGDGEAAAGGLGVARGIADLGALAASMTAAGLPVMVRATGEPYPVPEVTYGWAAGDAAYAMGSFDLPRDEALVIDGRSPDCAFWNLCLWNQFLHTYNYDYERVTINGGQLQYDEDGSWTIVVAQRDPGRPNWVSPAGHPRGRIWFRWFYPSETPARPTTRVVKVP